MASSETTDRIQHTLAQVIAEVSKVIIGQRDVIEQALITIFAQRHALIEGVPGVAKTLLVRTLAQLLGCPFQRVQFTPDVSPDDIIGTTTLRPGSDELTLIKGPVFTAFLLADEINRAPAKTQSALLQAMQERQVTVDRQTYVLSPNFAVFATQNPIESDGTYPLPEAQKDRFLMKIRMGYPSEAEETALAERTLTPDAPETLIDRGIVRPILTSEGVTAMRESLSAIAVRPAITQYIVAIVRLTRSHSAIQVGAGPRATQALLLSSRVHAAIRGHGAVTVEDVRRMALACLEHRLILKPDSVTKGLTCAEAVQHVLQSVPPPR